MNAILLVGSNPIPPIGIMAIYSGLFILAGLVIAVTVIAQRGEK